MSYTRKRRFSAVLWISMVLMLAVLLAPSRVSAATLNKIQTSVYVNGTTKLYPNKGKAQNWKSSNSSIATVNSKGVVTGRKKGTCTISCTVNGNKLKCTMNVRRRQTSKYVTNGQAKVWLNILGAIESGGQVYGKRDYSLFVSPYAGSPNEHSCTAGAYQEYGENLRQLLLAIKKQYPYSFSGRDTAGIASDIKRSWSDGSPYTIRKGSSKARCIQNIISCNAGAFVQDFRAIDLLDEYLAGIKKLGVTNLRCGMFMAECYHLGGYAAVKRVVNRAGNKNSLSSLRTSLYKDQYDTSNSYQIGDSIYRTRHEKAYQWLKEYISAGAKF